MQSILNEPEPDAWGQIAPLLDDALARLGQKDYDALVLRFFENKSLGEVALAIGASEDTARMRVNRALEKLRKFFMKRGVDSTAATIAETISTNSVQAAPVALVKAVTAVALAKGAAASISTLTLVKGALKIMAWTKAKTAILTGAVAILAATSTAIIGVELVRAHHPTAERWDILSPSAVNATLEIQPDGTTLFHATIELTNATSQTSGITRLSGQDKVFRVLLDESGQPMKFTELPGGHSVLITLPKPVPPGGRISWSVEGAITNAIKPNDAGECQFDSTNVEANVADMRWVETWRLPAGATLLGKVSGMEATTNAGLIELRSDQIVPPKGAMSISFRYRLPPADRPDILTPLSENVTSEMQPDGTTLFKAIVELTNTTRQTSELTLLGGADKLFRSFDESGKPMKFTQPPGTHYFLITLPKPVPPGGTTSWTGEGRVADVIKPNNAGEWQVDSTNSEPNVEDMRWIETWRLPAGATLLEKASGMEAATNAGQIELRSDQVVPPKGTMAIRFRYRLPAKTN